VLLEAMRHGVPCIAFDCPSGPRNIINDAYNGFLVYDGDIKLFAERLCQLIEDEDLRKYFSKKAIESAKIYDTDIIMNRWKALLEELTS
jgi:glycosyltransferase involved in cell wall biosynthesis